MMTNLAASPLVCPGHGSAHRRIVLRAQYDEQGRIEQFVVHRQYFYSNDATAYGDGDYFKADQPTAARQRFLERSSQDSEWPLAGHDILLRFIAATRLNQKLLKEQ